uniref:Uncharacterized protein n=1 Tax=Arundo donax TaxID=35708 RepID=A0A0A9FPT2_ARUDO
MEYGDYCLCSSFQNKIVQVLKGKQLDHLALHRLTLPN